MTKTNKQLANDLIPDNDGYYSHARYYKKLGSMLVYIAELKDPDNIPIGPHPFIIIDNDKARWAEHYEVEILRGLGPDLTDKSVFDFTSDADLIANVIGFDPADQEFKDLYIRTSHPVNKADDIGNLARKIGNNELETAAKAQRDRALNKWQRFITKMAKRGILVD